MGSFGELERVTRFELATYALARRRSTAELNPQMVGRGGFEPPKAEPSDLQSDPFGHFGISPIMVDRVGLEPTTCRLRVECSTIELAVHHM